MVVVIKMKNLDFQKELTPVVYAESAIKISNISIKSQALAFHTHWHNRIELLRITSGSLIVNINGEVINAKKNSVVVINPYLSHTGIAEINGAEYTVISFDISNFLNTSVASSQYLTPILEQKILLDNYVDAPLFISEVDEIINHFKTDPLFAISSVYRFLSLFFKNEKFRQLEKPYNNQAFYKIIKYLNENFCESLSISTISKMFGYSETYLCQKFKECTGLTIINYLNILRLEKAQKLLKTTDKSINEIAFSCGFNDLTYFSHCFKNKLNISPSDFRKRSKPQK